MGVAHAKNIKALLLEFSGLQKQIWKLGLRGSKADSKEYYASELRSFILIVVCVCVLLLIL